MKYETEFARMGSKNSPPSDDEKLLRKGSGEP